MPFKGNVNICFDCKNACGGCPWSAKSVPIPGWSAEKSDIGNKRKSIETYHITACPLFVPDEKVRCHGKETKKKSKSKKTACQYG